MEDHHDKNKIRNVAIILSQVNIIMGKEITLI